MGWEEGASDNSAVSPPLFWRSRVGGGGEERREESEAGWRRRRRRKLCFSLGRNLATCFLFFKKKIERRRKTKRAFLMSGVDMKEEYQRSTLES